MATPRKPRTVRRRIYRAPWHARRKLLSAHLLPELREKYRRRSFPIRKGDTIRVVRGDHRGEEGKVIRVDYKQLKIYVDAIKRERSDGRVVHMPIHPSNVVIVKLDLSDKRRSLALERGGES